MSTPYVGRPDDFGLLAMDQQQTNEFVEEAHRNGYQIGIHANGDVAIDMVLNAYERAQELWPRENVRHRIEHCSLVNESLLERIAAGGYIPTPVLDLRVLSRRQVGGVRGREDADDVSPSLVSGSRHSGGRRIRLHTGPVRTDDGDSEHGHAHGLRGSGLGTEAEDHGRRGAAGRYDQRCIRLLRGGHQGVDHPG